MEFTGARSSDVALVGAVAVALAEVVPVLRAGPADPGCEQADEVGEGKQVGGAVGNHQTSRRSMGLYDLYSFQP